jgi:hypothetical protein
MDLFYVEENFWFVEWWKCLMWYCTLVKELLYYMDSCEEVLKKRQHLNDENERKVNMYLSLTKCLMWKWINRKKRSSLFNNLFEMVIKIG